jgi:hypothetical protein
MFLLVRGFRLRFFNGNFSLFGVAGKLRCVRHYHELCCIFGREKGRIYQSFSRRFKLWESLVQLQKHPNILMLTCLWALAIVSELHGVAGRKVSN